VGHQVQLKKLPVLNAKGITIYVNNAGPLMKKMELSSERINDIERMVDFLWNSA
jgi:hypothetical protein